MTGPDRVAALVAAGVTVEDAATLHVGADVRVEPGAVRRSETLRTLGVLPTEILRIDR